MTLLQGHVTYMIPPKKVESARIPGLGEKVTITYEFTVLEEGQCRLRPEGDYPNLSITVAVRPDIISREPLDRLILVDTPKSKGTYPECDTCQHNPTDGTQCDKRLHKVMSNPECPSNKAYFGERKV